MQTFWQTVAGRTTIRWLRPVVLFALILTVIGLGLMLLNLQDIGLVAWKVKS